MAESIQLSLNDVNLVKGKINSKSGSWLKNMSSIEKEVQTMSGWFMGETGNAMITLYQRCEKEIKKDIEQFITEYNGTIDKAVISLQDADSSIAKQIGEPIAEAPPKADISQASQASQPNQASQASQPNQPSQPSTANQPSRRKAPAAAAATRVEVRGAAVRRESKRD